MYQREGKAAYKADLSNTLKLANYLGNPQTHFRSVHVAGTNGKGSTSHMLASVLQTAGYKVGLYTSPHLTDFRERIKINGEMIGKDDVVQFVKIHQPFFEREQLSFFEMTVGLAFEYFRNQKVDIAIIEVGLGGRLDSTNIINPEVSVITNIGLDHTQFLGDTLQKIAGEKAGIIKKGVPVVIGEATKDTQAVFREISETVDAPSFFAQEENNEPYPSDLKGNYQLVNQRTARVVLEVLKKQGWKISEEQVKKGLNNVVKYTGLLGRWQQLSLAPKVICDTAHNREGLTVVLSQLRTERYEQLHVVLGVVSDKDLNTVLPLFPKEAIYYFCAPQIARALDASILKMEASKYGLEGKVYNTVSEAYETALRNARATDFIYVGGSTFVVAEVLPK